MCYSIQVLQPTGTTVYRYYSQHRCYNTQVLQPTVATCQGQLARGGGGEGQGRGLGVGGWVAGYHSALSRGVTAHRVRAEGHSSYSNSRGVTAHRVTAEGQQFQRVGAEGH